MTTPSGLPTKALQYWGVARGAAAIRANTADTWAAINNYAQSQGQQSAGISLQAFNQLRSAATRVRNADEAFAAAPHETSMDPNWSSSPPWARELGLQAAVPQWQVQFDHTTQDEDGIQSTNRRTVVFTGSLPPTKGDVIDQVNQGAEALADNYGNQHVSADNFTIFRV